MNTDEIKKIRKPKTKYPVIDSIRERFSPRFFSSDKIREEDLKMILEAARLTPSAYNLQPWFFYYTFENEKAFKEITTCIPNKHHWSSTAPLYIIACCEQGEEETGYELYDLGQAVMSLVLQAQSLGYYARQIGNFEKDKAKKILNLPKNHNPFIIIVLGRIGDYTEALAEIVEMDSKPAIRKDNISKKL